MSNVFIYGSLVDFIGTMCFFQSDKSQILRRKRLVLP